MHPPGRLQSRPGTQLVPFPRVFSQSLPMAASEVARLRTLSPPPRRSAPWHLNRPTSAYPEPTVPTPCAVPATNPVPSPRPCALRVVRSVPEHAGCGHRRVPVHLRKRMVGCLFREFGQAQTTIQRTSKPRPRTTPPLAQHCQSPPGWTGPVSSPCDADPCRTSEVMHGKKQ